ncbi:unnamed protein product [Ectocarpus sp. 12 AP-2014]
MREKPMRTSMPSSRPCTTLQSAPPVATPSPMVLLPTGRSQQLPLRLPPMAQPTQRRRQAKQQQRSLLQRLQRPHRRQPRPKHQRATRRRLLLRNNQTIELQVADHRAWERAEYMVARKRERKQTTTMCALLQHRVPFAQTKSPVGTVWLLDRVWNRNIREVNHDVIVSEVDVVPKIFQQQGGRGEQVRRTREPWVGI